MYTVDPQNASNFVAGVDMTFMIILGVSIFFLVGLTVTMVYFIVRYRRDRHPEAVQNEGSTRLEILWTVIPLGLVMVMFYFGWMGWRPMKNPPEEGLRVKAIARMWNFNFQYENGKVTDSLIVPLGEPVILDLVAMDVLHSLYIPAFRVKEDMVPGQEKVMWFIPGQEGEYDLFCTEYCGLQHSYMYTGVRVIPKEKFDAWLADTTAAAPVEETESAPSDRGYQVLVRNGCNACHSSDGTRLVGPSYLGGWGGTRVVETDGAEREVEIDEEYIRKSIYDPDADIAKGFSRGMMLSYEGMVSEEEIDLIIAYLKALNE